MIFLTKKFEKFFKKVLTSYINDCIIKMSRSHTDTASSAQKIEKTLSLSDKRLVMRYSVSGYNSSHNYYTTLFAKSQ